jgi:hypothetical protein
MKLTSASAPTKTSAFFERGFLECAFTILLIVARGYSLGAAAIAVLRVGEVAECDSSLFSYHRVATSTRISRDVSLVLGQSGEYTI